MYLGKDIEKRMGFMNEGFLGDFYSFNLKFEDIWSNEHDQWICRLFKLMVVWDTFQYGTPFNINVDKRKQ